MIYRILFLLIFILNSPVLANTTQTDDFFVTETEIYKSGHTDRYTIWSGTFTENGTQAYLDFVKNIYEKNQAENPDLYFETHGFNFVSGERSPQSNKNFSVKNVFKNTCDFLKKCTVTTPKNIKANFQNWVKVPENKLRLTFTLISAAIDGSVNAMVLVMFNGIGIEHALIMGTTIASLTGSWSFFTPQLAKFFNNKPSLVDQLFEQKRSIAYKSGKWIEGLLKWGLVQTAFLSSISGVSQLLGIIHASSFGAWSTTILKNAALATAGQGVLDYSLSIEIDRSVKTAEIAAQINRVLKNSYIVGTIAASLSALGSLAGIFHIEFGNYILYGLLGAGTYNFARIYKADISRYLIHFFHGCINYLKSPKPNYEYWGSE